MTRGSRADRGGKKKKLCHKDIKRCCDSPAVSRRYGFRGSVSTLLARSPDRPNVTQLGSDGRVSSDGAKVGLFPLSSLKTGAEAGEWEWWRESVFSSLPRLNFRSGIRRAGA